MAMQSGSVDLELRERAAKVVPGGIWGHQNADRLPAGYPQFFARGKGCRVWDVDDREYIDFMCAWGPIVLGHADLDVNRIVDEWRAMGADCLDGPGKPMVELAELLVETVPSADWALFAKNGTDATSICVTLARAETAKRKVLVARGAYHGAAMWCTPSPAGIVADDRAHLVQYDYNDEASLEAAVEAAGGDLAAILVSAFRHDHARDQEMPTRTFANAARALATRKGAALIVDDVRAGFRINIGGSWEEVGVRADLSAWSKAIANGQPLAAVTGSDRFREAAIRIFTTGSFWYSPIPMAAAVATITKLKDIDGIAHMRAMGERFRAGMLEQSARHGIGLRHTGPASMPMMLFDDDSNFEKGSLFCQTTLTAGVFLHPTHNMFISCAHQAADIDLALEATEKGFKALASRYG